MTYVSNSFRRCQSAEIDGEICCLYLASLFFYLSFFKTQGLFIVMGVFHPSALIRSVYCQLHVSLWFIVFPCYLVFREKLKMFDNIDCVDVRDYYFFPPNPQMKTIKKWQCLFLQFKLCQYTPSIGGNWWKSGIISHLKLLPMAKHGNKHMLAHVSSPTLCRSLLIYFLKTDLPKILWRDLSTCQSNRTALKKLILVEYPFTTIRFLFWKEFNFIHSIWFLFKG